MSPLSATGHNANDQIKPQAFDNPLLNLFLTAVLIPLVSYYLFLLDASLAIQIILLISLHNS